MSTSRRRPLTRARIVDAGIVLADREGLDAFSMRKVAAALGYEVMSLYNHVANKDDLLDEMLDRVYAEVDDPPAALAWRDSLRRVATSARDELVRHPWAGELLTARFPGPSRRRHMEGMLRVLASAGLPDDVADRGFHALIVHIQGFTQQQIGFTLLVETKAVEAARFYEGLSADELPFFVAHLGYHAERGHRHDDFEFVLDLILDGLERAVPPRRPRRPS